MRFAAVHQSLVGTFETCRRTLRMSVYRGRPEVIGARSERRVWTQTGRMIQTRDLGGRSSNLLGRAILSLICEFADSTRRQSFSTRCSRRPSTRAASCTGTIACRVYFSSRDQRGFSFANARRRPTTNKPPEAGLSISCVVFEPTRQPTWRCSQPPGFRSVAADPRCGEKLLLISLGACAGAPTLTMR